MAEEVKGVENGSENVNDNAIDFNAPEVQDYLRKSVEKEVSGLKSKVNELLGKLKQKDEKLHSFGDYEPEQVHEVMKRFSDEEDAKLLKAGEVDAVFNRRVEKTIDRFSKQIEAKDAALKEAQQEREEIDRKAAEFQSKYHQSVINNAIAMNMSSELEDGALPHIQRMVEGWYEPDEKNNPVPTDRTPLNAKGHALPFSELKAYLIDTSPFYFRASRGGNLQSGKAGSNGKRTLTRQQFRDLPPAQQHEFSKSVLAGKSELLND